MKIVGIYSFNKGKEIITCQYQNELEEVQQVIDAVDSTKYKTKTSREKTMSGRQLYNPRDLNKAFAEEFDKRGWKKYKVECEYSDQYYVNGFRPKGQLKTAFREMDFVKCCLGVEVQFGKYAFMVYNVCAKMTIFRNFGIIKAGIEIVPVKCFAEEMSTGVSYFEQFVWDLEHRGVANIDIPVLILGVAE
ncbi:MAG: restriction endonuclease [Chloroflexus sp.]|nr:restriction endonuclease [Chloroflexus sp.]